MLIVYSGDSCHAMLPYLAQGANSAIEDGAALGQLLHNIQTKENLPKVLRMYEQIRKKRGDAIVRETFKQALLYKHNGHLNFMKEMQVLWLPTRGLRMKTVFSRQIYPSRCRR